MSQEARHALVFGATGFLGRHLVLALTQDGIRVTAATRSAESFAWLVGWLARHGCGAAPAELRVDFDASRVLQGEASAWEDVTEVYNCAGAYRFGMTMAEARHANVDSVRAIVTVAAGLPRLRRLVHVSGYRVGGQDPKAVPWSQQRVHRTYGRWGAYEASKVEADAGSAGTTRSRCRERASRSRWSSAFPRRLTKADPESLSFLVSDRYPTGPARELAQRHGLATPDTTRSILRWADHLAAHRFGAAPADGRPRAFHEHAGVRTFRIGEADAPTVVLPGLPVNADTWGWAAAALGNAQIVDLPGLGMTSGGRSDWPAWLASLLGQNSGAHLVGHSIGASAALEAAVAHPDKVGLITLVAPFFLQPPAGLSTRATPLTRRLTGVADHAEALESSVQDLRRGRVAANVATLLATAASERWRSQLRSTFARYPGPVQVIIGSEDPLANRAAALLDSLGPRVTLTTIPGAGHHPQLTHPDALSGAIGQHPLATPTPTKPHGRH